MLKANAQQSLSTPAVVGGLLFLAFGGLVTFLRLHGDPTEPLLAGRVLAAIAFGCLYAAPGILVFASSGRRPVLVAAASLGFGLIPTSFSITPLLMVPSVLVLIGWGRAAAPGPAPIRTLVVSAAMVAAGIGAAALLILDPQTICWETTAGGRTSMTGLQTFTPPPGLGLPPGMVMEGTAPVAPGGSGGCDGGAVPPVRSVAALALSAGGIGTALALGRRRRRGPGTVAWSPPGQ